MRWTTAGIVALALAALLWRSPWDAASGPAPALRPAVEERGDLDDSSGVLIQDAGPEPVRLDAARPSEQPSAPMPGPRVVARYGDGRPAVDVAVLHRRGELGDIQRDSNDDERWRSGADGTFPVPSEVLALLVDPSARSWFAADIPLAERNPVPGRLDESEEVVVPVPPTAALVLELSEAEGERWNGRGRVVFAGHNHERDQARFEGARVRIPHVRCERLVTLTIDGLGSYEEVELALPPLRVGEGERTHRVVLRDPHPIGVARFVDEANAPLGGARGIARPMNAVIEADEHGRASFPLRKLDRSTGPQTIRFLVYGSSRSYELEGEVRVETPLGSGELDLGVVVLRPIDRLVSGHLLQPDGAPWKFVDLAIVGMAEDGTRRTVEVGRTGSDGSFLVRRDRAGVVGLREPALDIALDSYPKLAAPVPFEAGQRDLVVTAPKPATLSITVEWNGPLPAPRLEVLWLRPDALPIRAMALGDGLASNLPLGTGSLVVVARGSSDPLTDARSVTTEAGPGGAIHWTVGAGVHDLRFALEGTWRVRPDLTYRTRPDGPFDHVPQRLGRGSYRILTRASRVDLRCRTGSDAEERVSVIEELGDGELLELGPEGLVRVR